MALRNKKVNDGVSAPIRRIRIEKPNVVIHVQQMDKQQEQRLSTAVDALLAELVRQEMGRAKSP
jgi:exonuclease I